VEPQKRRRRRDIALLHRNVNTDVQILMLANRVRLAKHQIISGRFRLARAKLLKMNMTQAQAKTVPYKLQAIAPRKP
jgi:hypothetical protein